MIRPGLPRWFVILTGLAALVALMVAVSGGSWIRKKNAVEGFGERAAAQEMTSYPVVAIRRAFAATGGEAGLGRAPYDMVGGHLLEGFLAYQADSPSLAFYPGEPSWHGRRIDAEEGFSRMLPFAAAWLAAGGADEIMTATGTVSLAAILRDGLVNGTDPDHPGYWGWPGPLDQRIVEGSDIALGLWLARDRVWPMLDEAQRVRLLAWLRAAAETHVFQGAWQLFPVLIERVVDYFGGSTSQTRARARTGYERFLALYRGDGWYYDMPRGFDYYNAWGMHYAMFWIDQIDPGWDPERIRPRLVEFAEFFRHLFGPHGSPIMGRSLCYRLALPAPILAAALVAPERVAPGEAMRALDATWSYYIARGAVDQGRITQGICSDDLALVDGYTGPASCLWSLRSLVVAYYAQTRQELFDVPRQPLPVERGDFLVRADVPGWTVEGNRADGHIRLRIDANAGAEPAPLQAYGIRNSLREWLAQAPRRPDNTAALYGRPEYSTAAPVSACEVRP